MPINPFSLDSPAAQAWTDQFTAQVREQSKQLWEQVLHANGLCTERLTAPTAALFDTALETGAVAMGLVLDQYDRLKEEG